MLNVDWLNTQKLHSIWVWRRLVARYLGVVEAVGSSPATQTKIGGSNEPPIFLYFLANPCEILCFCNIHNGLALPCFEG